jgi:nicotinic acid phosphoribosyltransferase
MKKNLVPTAAAILLGGLVSPAHVKTANMFGVVVSGAMVHAAVGADPSAEVRLPDGKFDFLPTEL